MDLLELTQQEQQNSAQAATEEYELEHILTHRLHHSGQYYEYKVRWVGYTEAEDTWLARDEVEGPRLNEYEMSYGGEHMASTTQNCTGANARGESTSEEVATEHENQHNTARQRQNSTPEQTVEK